MSAPIHVPSSLTDDALVAAVSRLAGAERSATASLIAHLAELYGRRLHEHAGFASLFTFCTGALGLSESEAYDRMKAAKVAWRHPVVLGMLAAGDVTLTTIRLLAPHLTMSNHRELLEAAARMGKRQVQELLAERFPQPDVPWGIRSLTGPMGAFMPAPAPLIRPLSRDRYHVTFTASGELCKKLEMAKDLLSHVVPSGDPGPIFERALELLVEELVRQKYAVTTQPRPARGTAPDSRHVPAEVKRAVYIRDRGRCAFAGSEGRTCGERAFVEFHHVVPFAIGGGATVENVQLRCRVHNGYEAEVFFGPARQYGGVGMDGATAESGRSDAFSFRNESEPMPQETLRGPDA
jgi:hypothetical protein